jgi:hypothetical protein
MVSLFITAFALVLAILLLSGIGLYFWQKTARNDSERILPPNPNFYGLFAEQIADTAMKTPEEIERARLLAASLFERARSCDKSALIAAKEIGDAGLYDQILNELVQQANSEAALVSLLSFVVKNELRMNVTLAHAAVNAWRNAPSRQGTAKALHLGALSDDAECFRQTIEWALELWRAGKLADVSAEELRALFDGEFWLLSARTRSSGAGFVLKRTLANARNELNGSVRRPNVSERHLPNEALSHGRASENN